VPEKEIDIEENLRGKIVVENMTNATNSLAAREISHRNHHLI